jgi:hypothetical protein
MSGHFRQGLTVNLDLLDGFQDMIHIGLACQEQILSNGDGGFTGLFVSFQLLETIAVRL